MTVTEIVPVGKNKSRVYLDDMLVGKLSNRDVNYWSLKVGAEVSDETWQKIEKDCIITPGKRKALDLLLVRERTVQELKNKLRSLEYTEAQIETIMDYLAQYPYLDDVRYGVRYIVSVGGTKSRRQIEQTLLTRGLTKSDVQEAFARYEEEYAVSEDEGEESREREAAARIVRKKLGERREISREERQKLYAMLARRGFSTDAIRNVLAEYDEDYGDA